MKNAGHEVLFYLENPFHVPIQVQVSIEKLEGKTITLEVPALDSALVYRSVGKVGKYRYRWVMGSADSEPDSAGYIPPFKLG